MKRAFCCLFFCCIASFLLAFEQVQPRIEPALAAPTTYGPTHTNPCPTEDHLELIDIDTLLYIDNRGLTRLFVDLNGHAFKLVTDPEEPEQSMNAFLIPQYGSTTINIAAYIYPGDANCIKIEPQGPPDTDAEIIIADLLVPGQVVAQMIEGLQELPERLSLLQSYPNPFRDRTYITYEVPEQRRAGLPVLIAIYDVAGRRLQVLVDDWRYPGLFSVAWDGSADGAYVLPSGVYFCHIQAGEFQGTIKLIRVR